MLKKIVLKPLIRLIVTNKISWSLINLMIRVSERFKFEKEFVQWQKNESKRISGETRLQNLFSDLTVKYGFFKGMKYPEFIAHGSCMYGKLLGSYESELSDVIEELCKKEYSEIIDVGCAEGYYAIGLAIRIPSAKVYAYDINPEAIKSCMKMATLNNVKDRLIFNSYCSPETLSSFNFTKRGLIVCDCEGYEIELFNKTNINSFGKCDLLIELHDGKNDLISPTLFNLFKDTHNIKIVRSINCFIKSSGFKELEGLTTDELKICLQERTGIMEWAYLTPIV